MDPWEITAFVAGWLIVLVVVFIILLVVVVFVKTAHLIITIRKKPRNDFSTEFIGYMQQATLAGEKLYGMSPNPSLESFRSGARWAWHLNSALVSNATKEVETDD